MTEPRMSFEEYLRRWSLAHGGYEPEAADRGSMWVQGWFRVAYGIAVRIPARFGPNAVTFVGVLLAVGALLAAAAGGPWVALAGMLVWSTSLADTVDGAAAVVRGRGSVTGFVLDSAADRVTDALFLACFIVVASPSGGEVVWWALAGMPVFLVEYVRARAATVGLREIGVVTVAERPFRVIVTVATLIFAGVGQASLWAAVGAGLWALLGLVGLAQLSRVVRRELRT